MSQEAETVKPGEIGFVMPPSAPPMEQSMNNLYPNLRKKHFSSKH